MTLQDVTLDSTRLFVYDVHGKHYPIKQQRGRYYIQHAKGQLTVTPLMKDVVPRDGTLRDYIFNGWVEHYSYNEFLARFN